MKYAFHSICIGLVLSLVSATAGAGERFTGLLGLSHDSNPANARSGTHERPDVFALGSITYEDSSPLTAQSLLQWRHSVITERYLEHERLSQFKAGSSLRYVLRPGDEFQSPLFALSASAAFIESASRIRSGVELRAGAFIERRITTRVTARLGAHAALRQSGGDAYDLKSRSLALDLEWKAADAWQAYLGYQYLDGDLVTTALPSPSLLAAANATSADDAFEAGESAFRLPARAHLGTLGFNYAWSPLLALDGQWLRVAASARNGNDYQRDLANLSLLARF